MGPLSTAAIFLVNTLFDLYLFVLMIRLILAYNRANYFNPITQFIIKLTQPLVVPVRRILPNFRNIEFSTLILILLIEIVKFFLLGILSGSLLNPIGLPLLAVADALKILLNTFFYAIFIQAILSWVQQGYSPVNQILDQITQPILRPFHRIIPNIGGFDITPIAALILLQLLIILVVNPLTTLGVGMTFG